MKRHDRDSCPRIVGERCCLVATTPMVVTAQTGSLLRACQRQTGLHRSLGPPPRRRHHQERGWRLRAGAGAARISWSAGALVHAGGKGGMGQEQQADDVRLRSHCLPWGFVRAYNTPYPHAYVHHPDRLVILWEQDNRFHMVPTDGRALPTDLEPSWMGTSAGRWEGDTLVVQAAGFNGRTWLDTAQHPHSDALRLTIRMTRPDYDHMNWDITIEDPKFYTKPIRNVRTFVLMPPGELYEYSCTENNRCEGGNCVAADVQKGAK